MRSFEDIMKLIKAFFEAIANVFNALFGKSLFEELSDLEIIK